MASLKHILAWMCLALAISQTEATLDDIAGGINAGVSAAKDTLRCGFHAIRDLVKHHDHDVDPCTGATTTTTTKPPPVLVVGNVQPYPAIYQPYPGIYQPYPANQQPYPGNQQPYPGNQQPYPANQGRAGQEVYPANQQPYPYKKPKYIDPTSQPIIWSGQAEE